LWQASSCRSRRFQTVIATRHATRLLKCRRQPLRLIQKADSQFTLLWPRQTKTRHQTMQHRPLLLGLSTCFLPRAPSPILLRVQTLAVCRDHCTRRMIMSTCSTIQTCTDMPLTQHPTEAGGTTSSRDWRTACDNVRRAMQSCRACRWMTTPSCMRSRHCPSHDLACFSLARCLTTKGHPSLLWPRGL
jgi:hypothetical protein